MIAKSRFAHGNSKLTRCEIDPAKVDRLGWLRELSQYRVAGSSFVLLILLSAGQPLDELTARTLWSIE